ncbi:MAG: hypothetical protein WCI64_08075 [Chlorobium sp.]
MSLLISFNRAASAEFSEATAWYESISLAFIFVRKHIVLLSWQYCMSAEIRPFGWIEPEKTFDLSGSSALLFDLPCRAEKRSSGSLPKI